MTELWKAPLQRAGMTSGKSETANNDNTRTQPYQGSRPANLLPIFGMEG